VLPYLRRLGPKPERIVNCAFPSDTLPGEGLYSLAARNENGERVFKCTAPSEDEDGTIGPCLRIGEVFVGILEPEARSSIGSPNRSVTTEEGIEADMHLVFNEFSSGEGAYYVVQYEEVSGERVVSSVQLTGRRPPIAISCSCLELGSPADAVLRQFGPPASVDSFQLEGTDLAGEFWSYDPYPITVEIVNGVVNSIKVWRPGDIPAQRRRPSLFYRP